MNDSWELTEGKGTKDRRHAQGHLVQNHDQKFAYV